MIGLRVAMMLGLGLPLGAVGQVTEVPAGQKVVLTAEGRGVQIYKCQVRPDSVGWVFVAPEAKLYEKDVEVGAHGAGPVWSYRDGSSVHGKALKTTPAPAAGAVPWLLLQGFGGSGDGLLAGVTYIQRTETKGGKAGDQGCDAAHEGAVSRVPYTATYTFYAAMP